VKFFRKFSEIIGKYCLGVRQISSGRFLKREIFSEIFRNYWKILSRCETTIIFRQVLEWWLFFREFSEIIGKLCLGVRQISSDRSLKGELFSEIFGNYWKILSGCKTTNLFRQVLKGWILIRKLLENIVAVRDYESLQTSYWMVIIFSEIFGNYWKILLECETTSLFRQVVKGWIVFSEIFGNYWKLLENIFGVGDEESLQTGS